jgi:BirA family biotin operon repressor/biotin-[acetyl-CoA-carboxylase] ligase
MTGEALRRLLRGAAAAWVCDIRSEVAVTSTNDVLKDLARAGAAEGTVVVAEAQTAGRGRQGRAWQSPGGNLFLSFLLRPPQDALVSLVPLAAGLAVAEALDTEGIDGRLKWPNDVLVGDKKIAGILAEASADARGIDSVIVGVGVNVNLDPAQLPDDVRLSATSLFAETRCVQDVAAVAAAVLGRWVLWYDALQADGARVRRAWRDRSVAWWGRRVEVTSSGERLTGIARDIDATGALVVETDDGGQQVVLSGDARALRPAD